MVALSLRFDLRNPEFAATTSSERVRAAVDMAAWAEARAGGVAVSLSEHHGSPDGYLPCPVLLATAVAARTTTMRIAIGAVIAPFYDPIRLAEDLAFLDALSEGRIDLVLGSGYRAEEFEMFGVAASERGRRTEEVVEVLRKAWTGEPFDYRGRTVRVTPRPHRPGGPPLVLGGNSAAAARRAARIADGFAPYKAEDWAVYRAETLRLGKPDPGDHPGGALRPTTFLADDPEEAWADLLPYFLHDNNSYAEWLEDASDGTAGPYARSTPDALRASGRYRILTPEAYVEDLRSQGAGARAHFEPMVGGVPPDLGWATLELYEQRVLPALTAAPS